MSRATIGNAKSQILSDLQRNLYTRRIKVNVGQNLIGHGKLSLFEVLNTWTKHKSIADQKEEKKKEEA